MEIVVIASLAVSAVFIILFIKTRSRWDEKSKEASQLTDQVNNLKERYLPIISIEEEVDKLQSIESDVREATEKLQSQYSEKLAVLKKLEQQVAIYDERISFAELGVYEPHFDFDDSDTYKENIKDVRDRQKTMVSDKTATVSDGNWIVDGSESKGRAMLNRQTRLTMRAFNNECEAAIANTRWNNVVAMERRIRNSAKQINNANKSMQLEIAEDYLDLKLDELFMTHEYREKLKAEKDERSEVARAEREEKKLIAEAQKAEREEKKYNELLEKARSEVNVDENRIAELEAQLANATEERDRARAMAEVTRSGFVYIISNVGSFGDEVVKIGLTRRLNPDDRVKELGDASVPFSFDTHAMIYAEDAPKLESDLHEQFTEKRVNAANMRKEFFKVSLDEVEQAVKTLAPNANFHRDREAQEWHETLSIRNQALEDMQKASDEFPESL